MVLNTLGTITGVEKADKTATGGVNNNLFSVESAVVQETTGNSLGGLTFLFQVTDTSAATLSGEIATNFSGYLTDVGYATGVTLTGGTNAFTPGNVIPSTAQRNGTFGVPTSGTALTFNFATTKASTKNKTEILVVQTNATKFKTVNDLLTRGNTTSVFGSYTPSGPVAPEPASIAAFGFIGMGLLGLMARARRSKTQMAA